MIVVSKTLSSIVDKKLAFFISQGKPLFTRDGDDSRISRCLTLGVVDKQWSSRPFTNVSTSGISLS